MHKFNNFQDYRNDLDNLFNFSFTQKKEKKLSDQYSESLLFTNEEKRALGMWIITILEPHSEQFLHALKHCRKLCISELNLYLLKHFCHLKTIIRFYVIAALMDYEKVAESSSVSQKQIEKQCIFLNILVQELASRFFRESQWLHKISHLQIYSIFPVFDPFLKGYTTVKQMEATIKIHFGGYIKKKKKLEKEKEKQLLLLIKKKCSSNIDGDDCKIYQQNVEEIMARASIIAFEEAFIEHKGQTSSVKYKMISEEIEKYNNKMTQRRNFQYSERMAFSRREKQELQLMRQDLHIKQASERMSRQEYASQIHKTKWESTEHKQTFSSTPYSTQITRTNAKQAQNRENQNMMVRSARRFGNTPLNGIQNTVQQQNKLRKEILFTDLKEVQQNKDEIAFREMIMKELQTIRQEKRRNHIQFLQYI